MVISKKHYETFAIYNRDMNQKIINAMIELGEDKISQDLGAFFKSIFATMVHIVVADSLWLKRFKVFNSADIANEIENLKTPKTLDEIIIDNLHDYIEVRRKIDDLIIRFINDIEAHNFSKQFTYKNLKGDEFTKIFDEVLFHFFNHQTHHRGQVTTLLSQNSIDIGTTDLVFWIE